LLLAHETVETPGSIDIEVRKNKSLWAQAPATKSKHKSPHGEIELTP